MNRVTPRGKFFWNSLIDNINWKKTWLLTYKFCIRNKVKDVHLRIRHKIYPTNEYVLKFSNDEPKCTFCKTDSLSMFFKCPLVGKFWVDFLYIQV